jgi:hypothetical protein
MFSFTNRDNPFPMKRISMVIPSSTKTSDILIVDVILAFKNRTVDTFFLPVIRVTDSVCKNAENALFQINCKVIKIIAEKGMNVKD